MLGTRTHVVGAALLLQGSANSSIADSPPEVVDGADT
jgi:hypothetical protein